MSYAVPVLASIPSNNDCCVGCVVALIQAVTLKTALSEQLVQVLHHVESQARRRMQEAVRSMPVERSLVPVALSPNPAVIQSAKELTKNSSPNLSKLGEEQQQKKKNAPDSPPAVATV